jgi:hypothetical protein
MVYEVEHPFGIFGLKKIPAIKSIAVLQRFHDPQRGYRFGKQVVAAADENKVTLSEICFQLAYVEMRQTLLLVKPFCNAFHVAISAIVRAFTFDCVPCVGNKVVHVTF